MLELVVVLMVDHNRILLGPFDEHVEPATSRRAVAPIRILTAALATTDHARGPRRPKERADAAG